MEIIFVYVLIICLLLFVQYNGVSVWASGLPDVQPPAGAQGHLQRSPDCLFPSPESRLCADLTQPLHPGSHISVHGQVVISPTQVVRVTYSIHQIVSFTTATALDTSRSCSGHCGCFIVSGLSF